MRIWFKRSIFTQVFVPIVFFGLLIPGAVFLERMQVLEQEAVLIAGQNAGLDLINTAKNARLFYANEVIPKAGKAGVEIHHDFYGNDQRIPLPASFMRALAEMSAKTGENAALRLYSDLPFRFRTAAESQLDHFERNAKPKRSCALSLQELLQKQPKACGRQKQSRQLPRSFLLPVNR